VSSNMRVLTYMFSVVVLLIFSLAANAFAQEHQQNPKEKMKTKKAAGTTVQGRSGVQQKTPVFFDFNQGKAKIPFGAIRAGAPIDLKEFVTTFYKGDSDQLAQAKKAGKPLVLVNITQEQWKQVKAAAQSLGINLAKVGVTSIFDYYQTQFAGKKEAEVFLPIGEVFYDKPTGQYKCE